MNATPALHPWSSEALFNKALLYAEELRKFTANDWQYALWSSLSLEFIARATLARFSPTLLADRKSGWRNVYYALGYDATTPGFRPSSLAVSEVLSIVGELVPEFTRELLDFCASHINRRNAELHTGEEAFSKVGTSEWLPKFYASYEVLLRALGKSLADVFDDPETATMMIASLKDAAAKAVDQDIQAHTILWEAKLEDARETDRAAATVWATRNAGHRVTCPACKSRALLQGSGQGVVTTDYSDDEAIVQRRTLLPASFECIACSLKIVGYSKLLAAGLGDAFTATAYFSPAKFFGLHTQEELEKARELSEPEWEEDYNE